MDRIRIRGGRRLHGEIQVSGAKNAALPLMTAALLTAEPLYLANVPDLVDIETMTSLLSQLGTAIAVVLLGCVLAVACGIMLYRRIG